MCWPWTDLFGIGSNPGMMPDCIFYRVVRKRTERVLVQLVRKALGDNSRILIHAQDEHRLRQFDEFLWLFDDESFIPHGMAGKGNEDSQPALLATGTENLNNAHLLASLGPCLLEPSEITGFSRVYVIFDGMDDAQLSGARKSWKRVVDEGWPAAYWTDESGRWQLEHRSAGDAPDPT